MRFRVTHVPCTLAVVLALILSALVALPCAVADEMPTEGTSVVEAVVQETASEELVLQEAVPEESVAPVDAPVASEAQPIPAMHGRPSVNGQLMVRGTKLCDLAGRPVTLGGVSTHGLQWFPEFVSSELFGKLSTS